jgi:hypothetical protein
MMANFNHRIQIYGGRGDTHSTALDVNLSKMIAQLQEPESVG